MKISWVATRCEINERGDLYSVSASTRYRCLIPSALIEKFGHDVNIIRSDTLSHPDEVEDDEFGDVVVFVKSFQQIDEILAGRAKKLGRQVVYDFCDLDFLKPGLKEHRHKMAHIANHCVATGLYLAEEVSKYLKIVAPSVISDPFEGPNGNPMFQPNERELNLLWFGHAANIQDLFLQLDLLANFGNKFPIALNVVTEDIDGIKGAFKSANKKYINKLKLNFTSWDPENTWESIERCDLVIIPSGKNKKKLSKSPNRLVESINGGRFVLAHPVKSYLEFAEYAYIGWDLKSGLNWAMANKEEIEGRVRQGQRVIHKLHSPEAIAASWLQLFKSL